MKILTLLLMVVALDCSANLNEGPLAPAPEHTSTTRSIVYELVAKHYVTKSINDVCVIKNFRCIPAKHGPRQKLSPAK